MNNNDINNNDIINDNDIINNNVFGILNEISSSGRRIKSLFKDLYFTIVNYLSKLIMPECHVPNLILANFIIKNFRFVIWFDFKDKKDIRMRKINIKTGEYKSSEGIEIFFSFTIEEKIAFLESLKEQLLKQICKYKKLKDTIFTYECKIWEDVRK